MSSPSERARRLLVAFGRFWWDFLVGDTPELLLGTLAVLGLVALAVHGVGSRDLAVVGFPVLVVLLLLASVLRAHRRASR